MPRAVIGIGGNHETTAVAICDALDALCRHSEVHVLQNSNLYRTDPMGVDAGDRFLNCAWLIDTTMAPIDLLGLLQRIEIENGRLREKHWGPRRLDLDIIFYADQTLASERLTLPHPHGWYRRFVIDPVTQVCPDWLHPVIGLPVVELRRRLYEPGFPVTVSGDVDPDWLTTTFRFEFRDVSFQYVKEAADPPVAGLGIRVASEPRELPPLWLHVSPESLEEFTRDVLTAARGQCRCLPPERA